MYLFIAGSSKENFPLSYIPDISMLLSRVAMIEDVDLVFGGNLEGMMKIACCEFKNHSKEVIRVDSSKKTMEMIQKLYEKSDCILFLPGGIETLGVLFSVIEENKHQHHPKKIILYNCNYFYTPIIKELYHLYQIGVIDEVPSNYMIIESNEDKVVELIEEMK